VVVSDNAGSSSATGDSDNRADFVRSSGVVVAFPFVADVSFVRLRDVVFEESDAVAVTLASGARGCAGSC
jgi:hypothetical protein